ncbi:hypothetical protein AaE_007408 [Aphanomyces astaci]|uniref:Uncharacterized protein n=1 Tax=Aphanomyces astaci TaxID=112090 RepID=A0A6A5AE45_APHAT|nr:hypothetical protein AaE_007408 [Aphanomyces astaci]
MLVRLDGMQRTGTVTVTLTLNPTITSAVLVSLSAILALLLICVACRCMWKANTPPKHHIARGTGYNRFAAASTTGSSHDYTHPFLGPPDYEQPYDEHSPPAYHELPSAPPLDVM